MYDINIKNYAGKSHSMFKMRNIIKSVPKTQSFLCFLANKILRKGHPSIRSSFSVGSWRKAIAGMPRCHQDTPLQKVINLLQITS